MKKIVYLFTILLFVTFGLQSCKDQLEVVAPEFEVSFNQTAQVGEPVVFSVKNSPNFLSYFSGETGHQFKNRERLKAAGEFSLSFETSRHYFDGASNGDNAFSFLMSTDYSGSGEIADVQSATWTDLSDQFTFATARTHDKTNSGTVDITSLASDLPTYFALRVYAEGKKADGNRQGVFRLYSFDISLAVANEGYSLGVTSLTNPGFNPVNVEGIHPTNDNKDFWKNKTNFYELNADQAEYTNDDWLITNPVNLSGAVSPDRGIPLKTYSDKLENFEYTFTAPGTYSLAFIGSNETIKGQEEMIKEYTITVTE